MLINIIMNSKCYIIYIDICLMNADYLNPNISVNTIICALITFIDFLNMDL